MDKLKKQIVINILIVVISVVVIFFAKSVSDELHTVPTYGKYMR